MSVISVMGWRAISVCYLTWGVRVHPAGLRSRTLGAQLAAALMYAMYLMHGMSIYSPQLVQTNSSNNKRFHEILERGTWWWASHLHWRWDSTGSAVVQLQLKCFKFTSNFFFLPCQFEEEAISGFQTPLKIIKHCLGTRACHIQFLHWAPLQLQSWIVSALRGLQRREQYPCQGVSLSKWYWMSTQI